MHLLGVAQRELNQAPAAMPGLFALGVGMSEKEKLMRRAEGYANAVPEHQPLKARILGVERDQLIKQLVGLNARYEQMQRIEKACLSNVAV